MQGLMQDWPLTVDRMLDHAKRWHGEREIVSRDGAGVIERTNYARIHARARKLSAALLNLGVKPGDRIATMAWNSAQHLECWYAIMGIGAVCHTLNPRLFPEQLCYIINHAQDRMILTDAGFLPMLLDNRAGLGGVERYIALGEQAEQAAKTFPGVTTLESLIDSVSGAEADQVVWGDFDENAACGLCYTSGTTGNPKGVLYSHRSNFLHTLVSLQMDALSVSNRDVVLPIVPMFHANAWGLAFSCPSVGAKLVLPGPRLDGASLCELMETEQVTMAAGVPTVWQGFIDYVRATGRKPPALRKVMTGGSSIPEALMRALRDEVGVEVFQAWGMTETSPVATCGNPDHHAASLDAEGQLSFALTGGRPLVGVDLRLTDEDGVELARDGEQVGHLKVKGSYVVGQYFGGEAGNILDADGYFDSGDMATIDRFGYVRLTDRAKDVIKSGGEWISSIELENLACGYSKTAIAAVIARPHPKWGERPLLVVQLKPGETATAAEYLAFYTGKIARWQTPDDVVFIDKIPLGATGKIDKKALRRQYTDYVLPTADVQAS